MGTISNDEEHKVSIHHDRIDLETSQLLKEAGFCWYVRYFNCFKKETGEILTHRKADFKSNLNRNTYDSDYEEWFSAPNYSLVIKWLIEAHNIYVSTNPLSNGTWVAIVQYLDKMDKLENVLDNTSFINPNTFGQSNYPSFYEARYAAVIVALGDVIERLEDAVELAVEVEQESEEYDWWDQ